MSLGDIRQLYPEQFERIMQLGEFRAQKLAERAARKAKKAAKSGTWNGRFVRCE